MTLCATFEAAHRSTLAHRQARHRFLARPLFERLARIEAHWRTRGEEAIKAEMELRIRAWLLSAKER